MGRPTKTGTGEKDSSTYEKFSSGWTGLAAMILLQAVNDLERLNGRDSMMAEGWSQIRRWEIINFLRGPWGLFPAGSLNITREEVLCYVRKHGGI